MAEHYDFVIIGNSAAGLQALRTLRKHGQRHSVAIIDREDRPAYSRVLTPYYIGGQIEREGLDIVGSDYYRQLEAVTIFGQAVMDIEPDAHVVELADGRKIGYGKLLLATGAEARTLKISGERVCTLRHMADAEKLTGIYPEVRSITAIGAGLVSLPLLSHAAPDIEKHLVVGSDRIFSRVVDPAAAALLEEQLTAQGLQIHKQNDITSLAEGERLNLTLRSGKQLISDLLVVGKGVAPNTALAAGAGLQIGDGVRIDRFCCSSVPDIYAAGDVAEGADFVTGEPTVQGNWMTAVEQGENAALNMLGFEAAYEGSLKNNITEVFGVEVAAVGYCQDDAADTVCSWNAGTGRYRKLFLDSRQRVIGATLIGETNDAGLYYQLVRTRSSFPGKVWLGGTASHAQTELRLAS